MTPRWNICRAEFGLGLMVCILGLSNVAAAQPGDATSPTTPGSSDQTTGTPAPSASTEAGAAPAAEADKAVAPANAPAATTAQAAAVPAAPPAPPKEKEVEPTPTGGTPLTVEILPGSGYPEPKVRGLVGGSLWLTMHGLQFPYAGPETSPNQVRLAISGSIWDDTSFARLNSGRLDITKSLTRWYNQGRGVVRFTPSYTTREGWFVQGQIETVGNIEQTVVANNIGTVDDMFARVGKWNVFDVTVGRFQGWEVYHYGMGLDLNTLERTGANLPNLPATQIYGLNSYWDRPAFGVGNYAAHVYLTDYLRFEVLGQIGTQGSNVQATRPVAVLDLGYLKVKAGWEYGVTHGQQDGDKSHTRQNGVGGAIQFVANPYIEGGVNGAIGYLDYWIDTGLPKPENSTTTKSYGGFLNGRIVGPLMIGIGGNETRWNNLRPNSNPDTPKRNGKTDYSTHFQGFGAIQYSFWDKLFFKFVANYARFHYQDVVQEPAHPYTNTEWGGRLRMMYLF